MNRFNWKQKRKKENFLSGIKIESRLDTTMMIISTTMKPRKSFSSSQESGQKILTTATGGRFFRDRAMPKNKIKMKSSETPLLELQAVTKFYQLNLHTWAAATHYYANTFQCSRTLNISKSHQILFGVKSIFNFPKCREMCFPSKFFTAYAYFIYIHATVGTNKDTRHNKWRCCRRRLQTLCPQKSFLKRRLSAAAFALIKDLSFKMAWQGFKSIFKM